jgi:drug/metabolite transporter (DMT)-like permease
LFGTLALPTTELAWMGFTGVAVASTAGTLTFLCGMAYFGAARAAMISNLEPVLGVLFAITVLGECVTPLQGTGITLVLRSIVAI